MRARARPLRRLLALALLLGAAAALPAMPAMAADLAPRIERATRGERCVEDTATMRRYHMRFLEHQRDATVQGGIRGARHSLRGCIDCHASTKTGSVAATAGDFCAGCHIYTGIKVDCFECHTSRRESPKGAGEGHGKGPGEGAREGVGKAASAGAGKP
jgi:hypothetical protein